MFNDIVTCVSYDLCVFNSPGMLAATRPCVWSFVVLSNCAFTMKFIWQNLNFQKLTKLIRYKSVVKPTTLLYSIFAAIITTYYNWIGCVVALLVLNFNSIFLFWLIYCSLQFCDSIKIWAQIQNTQLLSFIFGLLNFFYTVKWRDVIAK